MRELKSVTLKVDLSPGTDITEACYDLCELANRVGCMVEANFNGVKLWATQDNNPVRLIRAYEEAAGSKRPVKIANGW